MKSISQAFFELDLKKKPITISFVFKLVGYLIKANNACWQHYFKMCNLILGPFEMQNYFHRNACLESIKGFWKIEFSHFSLKDTSSIYFSFPISGKIQKYIFCDWSLISIDVNYAISWERITLLFQHPKCYN